MYPNAELRARLDSQGRLRSHLTGDFDEKRDLQDAGDLLTIASAVSTLHVTVERGTQPRNAHHARGRLGQRAGRELLERIWENPRRRHRDATGTGKYALDALWSPLAVQARAQPAGRLQLEHVVPAGTIVSLLATYAEQGRTSADAVRLLAELCTHVVMATGPGGDRGLARVLGDATTLERHYCDPGGAVTPDELFEARWARYLDAERDGVLTFGLDELGPVPSVSPPD